MDLTLRKTQARYRRRSRWHISELAVVLRELAGVCGLAMENARRYQKIKNTENQLRNEKEKLEAALAEVKKLSGLIPICGHCKKIRDDKGYWNQVEAYIQEHSEAKFSHGICRDCAKKYYPGYDLYEEE